MPILLLVRHGETDYVKKGLLAGRAPDAHLNAKGRTQAAGLGEALKHLPLRAVYSSPLERTLETAQAIARPHKMRVRERPGLIETDLGSWQGQSVKKLERTKEWKMLQETPSRFRFPGGETVVENQTRLVADIAAICKMHRTGDLLVCVGHADPIKLIVAHYLGLHIDLFQRITIGTASVSTLVVEKSKGKIINLNWLPDGFGK